MPYQIIYASEATAAMSVSDLERILADARSGTAARGITGALVYVEGVFLQILEGKEEPVRELMRRIAADPRHAAVKVFHAAEVDEPLFDTGRMAFLSATPAQMAVWAGLEGAASVEVILEEIRRSPQRVARVVANLLKTLAARTPGRRPAASPHQGIIMWNCLITGSDCGRFLDERDTQCATWPLRPIMTAHLPRMEQSRTRPLRRSNVCERPGAA